MENEAKIHDNHNEEVPVSNMGGGKLRELEAANNALRESEERYKRLVNAVTSYIYSVELKDGEVISTWHSKGCIPITGYKPEDYQSDPYLWHSMIYPDDRSIVESSVSSFLLGREIPPVEHRIIRRDGTLVWIRNTMVPSYDKNGTLLKYDGLIEDITFRKEAEEALRESEEKFRTIAETAVDAIVMANSRGDIIFWNKSGERIFGYTEHEIMGKPLSVLMPDPYREAHQKGLERVQLRGTSRYFGRIAEMHGLRKNGKDFPIELSVSMWKVKDKTFYSGIIRDITKRKSLEKELENLATTDSLTQVFNRTKFYDAMKVEIERAKRYNHPLSLIMFDIDHFKAVNDTYGHTIGDSILQTLVKIVKKSLREIDLLVRWGGEEFVIITPETDSEKALIVAERIRIETETYEFDQVGHITVSLGIAQFRGSDNEDSVVKRADDAMYQAKRMGRNRVEIITE